MKGPIIFLPLAFFLCLTMASFFMYWSIPSFHEKEILPVKALVISARHGEGTAQVFWEKDTALFEGKLPELSPGKELQLAGVARLRLVKLNKEELLRLLATKNRSKWMSWISASGLLLTFVLLYKKSKKQHG
ncbi:MAG: hypothetical protein MUF42_01280 [Cytophagaceae bacterium]|jgi:hypothetical protein|nr:hypothetical protein [Cytophagaceae bacterium]